MIDTDTWIRWDTNDHTQDVTYENLDDFLDSLRSYYRSLDVEILGLDFQPKWTPKVVAVVDDGGKQTDMYYLLQAAGPEEPAVERKITIDPLEEEE